MSYLILLLCFGLIALFFKASDLEKKFLYLFGVLVLFSGGFYFYDKPVVAAVHIPFYCFIANVILVRKEYVHSAWEAFPIKKCTLFLFVTFIASGIFGESGGVNGAYVAARLFVDSYGFFIVAFILGYKCDYNKITESLFWPIVIFFAFELAEAFLRYNYPVSWMLDTFPIYEGYLGDTWSSMNFHDSWRIRTAVTTLHPTTLGALMTALFIFFFPQYRDGSPRMKILLVLLAIGIFLAGSRSAWVCSILYLGYYYVKKQSILMKVFFASLCFAAIVYAGNAFVGSFNADDRGSSIDMRQRNLLVCLIAVAEKPVLGHGFNYMGSLVERDDNGYQVDGAMESVFYNLIVEQGFVGLFSYFAFVFVNIWVFRKMKARNEKLSNIGESLAIIITIFSLMSGTLGMLNSMTYMLQGACMGMLCFEKPERDADVLEE